MPSITIKNIPDPLLARLRALAEKLGEGQKVLETDDAAAVEVVFLRTRSERIGELEEENENQANEIADLRAKCEDMEHDHALAKDQFQVQFFLGLLELYLLIVIWLL